MELTYDPPLPRKPGIAPFVQTIRLMDGDETIGRAMWHSAGDDGIVQILTLTVFPPHQRVGHGRRLMNAIFDQGRKLGAARTQPLRRMWICVEQKSQIIGRAFLTGSGFHHVATLTDLLKKQDALLYTRTFD